MKIIDGKLISQQILSEISLEVQGFIADGKRAPHLAVIIIGSDGGSQTYVNNKVKACEVTGFQSTKIAYPENISESEVLEKIIALNNDSNIDGLIVQLPVPKHINEHKILETIDYRKDVDGFHPINTGRMMSGLRSFISATPNGIIELMRRYNISPQGKNVVIIGRSNIVGKPLANLLLQKGSMGDATVTVCHSRTKDIASIAKQADILIAAIGQPNFITAEMVKEGAVVIDVGTTRVPSEKTKSGWKLCGDVNFEEVSKKASYISPVPGGVGPMTITSLLMNTLLSYKKEIYS